MKKFCPGFIFILALCLLCGQIIVAQENTEKQKRPKRVKEEKVVKIEKATPPVIETVSETETQKVDTPPVTTAEMPVADATEKVETPSADKSQEKSDNKSPEKVEKTGDISKTTQTPDDEAEVTKYYDTAVKEYYLGPQDVISVEVFGQPNYSKGNITIPPTGRISYPLIREGVTVKGKTVEQVAEEIKKKLDEYIIDPQVSVFLDKAGSARFSILGDVAAPGVRIMDQRVSLMDAIALAGGMAKTADVKRVTILRGSPNGMLQPITVDLSLVLKGKLVAPYIEPGDQIIVPGKKLSVWEKLLKYTSVVGFARTFSTGGF